MKRTLMLKNQELLDFEVDTLAEEIRILDAPAADDPLLASLGLGGPDRGVIVAKAILSRHISAARDDFALILDAFGARSRFELSFMGHGLSLIDKLWYRAPGATERWEDINFLDNDWDSAFCTSVLTRDYKNLASCSPDIPDFTTKGHLRKAWERAEDGIQLLKEPMFENGYDLTGAQLGAELCSLLFGQDAYQPLNVVERYGKRFAASPLMVGGDEELVQGWRLFAMGGFDASESARLMGHTSPQSCIDVIARAGVADASAHVAKTSALRALSFLAAIHTGNYGIICNLETGARHGAPPFDYDRSFGFPFKGAPFEALCNNPKFAALMCVRDYTDLDSSWDWSWYDPHALEGFEGRIVEAYAGFTDLPANFGELIAGLFIMQRNYVTKTASKRCG